MGRTTYYNTRAGFIADPHSITRSGGVQIDWANVAAGYVDATSGKKVLKAGTAVGSLLSGNGSVSPRVVTTNPAVGLLATDAVQDDPAAPLSGYGLIKGGIIYETLLPDASGSPPTLAAAIKTELQAAGVSTGFVFVAYSDAR